MKSTVHWKTAHFRSILSLIRFPLRSNLGLFVLNQLYNTFRLKRRAVVKYWEGFYDHKSILKYYGYGGGIRRVGSQLCCMLRFDWRSTVLLSQQNGPTHWNDNNYPPPIQISLLWSRKLCIMDSWIQPSDIENKDVAGFLNVKS